MSHSLLRLARCSNSATVRHLASLSVVQACIRCHQQRACSTSSAGDAARTKEAAAEPGARREGFDDSLLPFLMCPVSKQTLRYDAQSNELISEALGVAFPIRNGLPVLIPLEGRLLMEPEDDDVPTS